MESHPKFFYINFQKAGSSFCAQTIRKNFKTKTIKNDTPNRKKLMQEAYNDPNVLVFSSIREPVSWYKSLFQYMKEKNQNFKYFKQDGSFNDFVYDLFNKKGAVGQSKFWHSVIDFSLMKERNVGLMTLLYINYFYPEDRKTILNKIKSGEDIIEIVDSHESIIDFICDCTNLNEELAWVLKKATNKNISFPKDKINPSKSGKLNVSEEIESLIKEKEYFIYNKYYS